MIRPWGELEGGRGGWREIAKSRETVPFKVLGSKLLPVLAAVTVKPYQPRLPRRRVLDKFVITCFPYILRMKEK